MKFFTNLFVVSVLSSSLMVFDASADVTEAWSIVNLRAKDPSEEKRAYLVELRRREFKEYGGLLKDHTFRLSVINPLVGSWTSQVGLGLVNTNQRTDEKRLHVYALRSYKWEDWLRISLRFGFESRDFEGENPTYVRSRNRIQLQPFPDYAWGVILSEELLLMLNDGNRYVKGFHENRVTGGIRYTSGGFEAQLILTDASIQSKSGVTKQQWLQAITSFNF